MNPLKLLALQHLSDVRERNKTNSSIQFGDKVTAAMMFTYADGTQEIVAVEPVTIDDLKEFNNNYIY